MRGPSSERGLRDSVRRAAMVAKIATGDAEGRAARAILPAWCHRQRVASFSSCCSPGIDRLLIVHSNTNAPRRACAHSVAPCRWDRKHRHGTAAAARRSGHRDAGGDSRGRMDDLFGIGRYGTYQQTPLGDAISAGEPEMLRFLLERGAIPPVSRGDFSEGRNGRLMQRSHGPGVIHQAARQCVDQDLYTVLSMSRLPLQSDADGLVIQRAAFQHFEDGVPIYAA